MKTVIKVILLTFTITIFGCSSDSDNDQMIMSPPEANFTYTNSTNSSIVNFNNSTGNSSSTLWNFGDGTTSSELNPSHTYNNDGFYVVSLTVNNDAGASTKSVFITISTYNGEPILTRQYYPDGSYLELLSTNRKLNEARLYNSTGTSYRNTTYIYLNDLIIKQIYSNSGGADLGYTIHEYNDEKNLIVSRNYYSFGVSEGFYNYNSDGTVTITYSDGTSRIESFENGEIKSCQYFNSLGGSAGMEEFEWDNKKNPLKNFVGFQRFAVAGDGIFRNITSLTSTYEPTRNKVNTYTYNSLNYPTSITTVYTGSSEPDLTLTYTY